MGRLWQGGHLAQNSGDEGGGAPISPDGVASSRIVDASASVIFPCFIKTQKMACKNTIVGCPSDLDQIWHEESFHPENGLGHGVLSLISLTN